MINAISADNATMLSEYNAKFIADSNNTDDTLWEYKAEPVGKGSYWRVKVSDEEGVDLGYL